MSITEWFSERSRVDSSYEYSSASELPEKSVTFDLDGTLYNSLTDIMSGNLILQHGLGLIFKSLTVDEAKPKVYKVSVPYRDGDIDMTSYFGMTRYENRTLNMDFIIPIDSNGWEVYSNVATLLNGQYVKIMYSADYEVVNNQKQYWNWEGRLSVGGLSIDNGMFTFSITADVNPYKQIKRTIEVTLERENQTQPSNMVLKVSTLYKTYPQFVVTDESKVRLKYYSYEYNEHDLQFTATMQSNPVATYSYKNVFFERAEHLIRFQLLAENTPPTQPDPGWETYGNKAIITMDYSDRRL